MPNTCTACCKARSISLDSTIQAKVRLCRLPGLQGHLAAGIAMNLHGFDRRSPGARSIMFHTPSRLKTAGWPREIAYTLGQ